MTTLQIFGDTQLITLSLISRAVCDLVTTVSIAWSLKQKRDSSIREYDYASSRLLFLTLVIERPR